MAAYSFPPNSFSCRIKYTLPRTYVYRLLLSHSLLLNFQLRQPLTSPFLVLVRIRILHISVGILPVRLSLLVTVVILCGTPWMASVADFAGVGGVAIAVVVDAIAAAPGKRVC